MLSIILALHTHPINLYVLNFACIFIYVHIFHDIFIWDFRLITHGCLLLARKRCKNSSRATGDLTHNGRLNARENLGSLFDTRLSSMVEHTLFYLPIFVCVYVTLPEMQCSMSSLIMRIYENSYFFQSLVRTISVLEGADFELHIIGSAVCHHRVCKCPSIWGARPPAETVLTTTLGMLHLKCAWLYMISYNHLLQDDII